MLSPLEIRRYYEQQTYVEDAANFSEKTLRWRVHWIFQNGLHKMSVLELGCGTGICRHYFKSWVGLDIAKTCKPTVVADACYLPFIDDSFEAVVGFFFLEHVKDQKRVLKEAVRVARKIVKFFSPEIPPQRPDYSKIGMDYDAYGYDPVWTEAYIRQLFEEKTR